MTVTSKVTDNLTVTVPLTVTLAEILTVTSKIKESLTVTVNGKSNRRQQHTQIILTVTITVILQLVVTV